MSSGKKPRRPLTAYNYFFHDERQILQARLFRITGQRPTYTQISRLVGANWKKITPEKKAGYEALAIKDKRRYALELLKMKEGEEYQVKTANNSQGSLDGSIPDPTKTSNPEITAGSTTTFLDQTSLTNSTPTSQVVDPSSIAYQVMLRQSLNENRFQESDFLAGTNPGLTAQIALLSVMMIDYVQKVAPERLATSKDSGPPGFPIDSVQSLARVQDERKSDTVREAANQFGGERFDYRDLPHDI